MEEKSDEPSEEEVINEIVGFVEGALLGGAEKGDVIKELASLGIDEKTAEELIEAVEAKIEAIDAILSWMEEGMAEEEIMEKLMSYEVPEEDAKYLFEEAKVIKKQIDAEKEILSVIISWIKEGSDDEEMKENLISVGMAEEEALERIRIARELMAGESAE